MALTEQQRSRVDRAREALIRAREETERARAALFDGDESELPIQLLSPRMREALADLYRRDDAAVQASIATIDGALKLDELRRRQEGAG